MTASEVRKSPPYAPAQGLSETILRGLKVVQGPTVSYVSTDFPSTATVTVELFHIPSGVYVVDLVLKKTTAWTGTGNVFLIGDSDDTDKFLTSALLISTDAGTVHSIGVPVKYESSDPNVIIATINISTGTNAGSMIPYLIYADAVV